MFAWKCIRQPTDHIQMLRLSPFNAPCLPSGRGMCVSTRRLWALGRGVIFSSWGALGFMFVTLTRLHASIHSFILYFISCIHFLLFQSVISPHLCSGPLVGMRSRATAICLSTRRVCLLAVTCFVSSCRCVHFGCGFICGSVMHSSPESISIHVVVAVAITSLYYELETTHLSKSS